MGYESTKPGSPAGWVDLTQVRSKISYVDDVRVVSVCNWKLARLAAWRSLPVSVGKVTGMFGGSTTRQQRMEWGTLSWQRGSPLGSRFGGVNVGKRGRWRGTACVVSGRRRGLTFSSCGRTSQVSVGAPECREGAGHGQQSHPRVPDGSRMQASRVAGSGVG